MRGQDKDEVVLMAVAQHTLISACTAETLFLLDRARIYTVCSYLRPESHP